MLPKRTLWLVTGVAVGAGSSLWAERKIKKAAERLQPDALLAEVGRSARSLSDGATGRVRDAVQSGREEMSKREQELWAELADKGVTPVASPPVAPLPTTRRQRRRATAPLVRG